MAAKAVVLPAQGPPVSRILVTLTLSSWIERALGLWDCEIIGVEMWFTSFFDIVTMEVRKKIRISNYRPHFVVFRISMNRDWLTCATAKAHFFIRSKASRPANTLKIAVIVRLEHLCQLEHEERVYLFGLILLWRSFVLSSQVAKRVLIFIWSSVDDYSRFPSSLWLSLFDFFSSIIVLRSLRFKDLALLLKCLLHAIDLHTLEES